MPLASPRCFVALGCMNVSFQGGTQVPNYQEVIDQFAVPVVPVGVARFFAVYELREGTPGVYTTKMRIEGPNGFGIEQRTMDISFTTEKPNARIAMEMRQFGFPHFGRYKFALLVSDEEVGYFTIDIKLGDAGGFIIPPQPQQGQG
jgi:hypothetical protein